MVIMLFKSIIDLIDRVKEKSFLYSLIEQCTDCSHDEIIAFKKQLSREEQITFLKSLKYKESYKDGFIITEDADFKIYELILKRR
jgi:hypothetical protein